MHNPEQKNPHCLPLISSVWGKKCKRKKVEVSLFYDRFSQMIQKKIKVVASVIYDKRSAFTFAQMSSCLSVNLLKLLSCKMSFCFYFYFMTIWTKTTRSPCGLYLHVNHGNKLKRKHQKQKQQSGAEKRPENV